MPTKKAQDAATKPARKRKPTTKADKPAVEPKTLEVPVVLGRPCSFTQELGDRICEMLASGMSMRTACKEEDMPSMQTVFRWLRTNEAFCEQYTRAKAEAADALVEEMLDISDDGTNDWMEVHDKEGNAVGYKVNGEHVQRSRLRVETRKWIAAKLKPKKYGEKVDLNHGLQPENPIAALLQQVSGSTLKPEGDQ